MSEKHIYNLLFIDDEIEIAKSIFRQFHKEYNLFTASNAQEAIAIMEKENIQIVISDQRMPGMSSVDFFSLIKAKYPDAVKLMISGDTDTEAIIGAINEGQVIKYLAKPWKPEELSSVLIDTTEKYELITRNKQLVQSLDKSNTQAGEIKKPESGKIINTSSEDEIAANRKQVEEALKENEEKYRTLVEGSLQGMVVALNNPIRLAFASSPMETISGYSPEELETFGPQQVKGLIHPDDQETFFKSFTDRVSGKNVNQRGTYRIQHKNGSVRWVELFSTLIQYRNEPATQTVFIDITEQKDAEHALQRSEEKQKSYVENAPLGIFVVNGKGKYIDVNPEGCRLLGYSRDELIKLSIPDIKNPKETTNTFPQLKKEGFVNYEGGLRRKDGSIVDVRLDAVALPNDQFIAFCTDITERKKAEAELKKQRDLFELVINSANVSIFWKDLNSVYLGCNTLFAIDAGMKKPEDVIGKDDYAMVWKEYVDEYRTDDKLVISTGKPKLNYEEQFLNIDGEKVFWKTSKMPLRGSNGKIIGIIATAENITERRKAEIALINNQQRYEKAQMMGHVGNWEYDPATTIFWASDEAKRIYGFDIDIETLPSENVERCIPQRERVHQALIDLIEHDKKYDLVFDIITNDKGIRKTIHSIAETEKDTRGKVKKVTGVISDITQRKKADEELLKSEEKYRKLYESNLMPISIFDVQTLEFLSVNNAFVEKYGYTREEFLKMTILDIRPESEFESLKYSVKKEDKGLENIGVWLHKKKNGEIIDVEIIRYNLVFEGRNAKLVFVNDISELKRSEIELRKSKDKAEESDRLKSAFLTNMSHEIRTPMNGILGFTDLLKEPELSGERQQKYISIIEKSGERMLSTINDIIDISKIESKQVEVSISDVNLNKQIDELFEFFQPEAEKKNIQFTITNRLPDQYATIQSDQEKIVSILTNLLKNAIKYTDNGAIEFGVSTSSTSSLSELTSSLSESITKLKADSELDELKFYIKDTGIGIPTERQMAIFNRFVQADIADTRAFEGSGLGLAISKAYVQMLGGKIWVESEEGLGSQFYFTIPFSKNTNEISRQKNESVKKAAPPKKGLKILIVEDEEIAITYLSVVLRTYKKEILVARTGIEAVEMCENNPDIDLILMDIRIPEIDGYEATRKIRTINKDVFIVAQTAFAQAGDREKCIEAGCDNYVTKPINKQNLLEIIDGHF